MMSSDPQYYIQGVLAGNRFILAKSITLIESTLLQHQEVARAVIDEILPSTGTAVRLGITGVPGAGKSTFIEAMGNYLCDMGKKLAVLAVDPSSSRSGGSILADKTRMERLSIHKNAFIRPSPAGGTLGGVASRTRETMLLCEAAGFDVVIVETVGVGQSETVVSSMVDFFLVLMISGAGDELQGIKKGVLEMADAIAVNKADGDNIARAKLARKEYEAALQLLRPASPNWRPPVLTCSAREMTGIDTLWEIILEHREIMTQTRELEAKRKEQNLQWLYFMIREGLEEWFYGNSQVKKILPILRREVERGRTAPTVAVKELLSCLFTSEDKIITR